MKKLRGAIVGFGRVAAEAHLPGFERSPGFEIVAVVDAAAGQRAVAQQRLPEARVYESLAELAEKEERKVDFVDVATPPRFHVTLAVEALERGFHVLCEKPLALGTAELAELRRAVRRTGRSVFTVHNWKYAPLVRRLRGLIGAATVGELQEIEWRVERPDPPMGAIAEEAAWRLDPAGAGGGILMDHGWHAFYLLPFLTGRRPRAVSATLGHLRGLAVEDTADCTLDFGTCTARIHLSWTAPARRTGGVVRGTLGTIDVEDEALVVRVTDRPPETTRFAPALSASSYHPEWFPPLLEDFRAEILHVDRRGRNLGEAVGCSELITAAYASNGEPVALTPPEGKGEGH